MIGLSEQLDDIRNRLEVIAEELADLALDRLKESLAEGTDASEERRLTSPPGGREGGDDPGFGEGGRVPLREPLL